VTTSIHDLAARRYSCRDYVDRPLSDTDREGLAGYLAALDTGPLGNRCRFALVAARPEDRAALKGLGTYGFIKGATGFIVGAVRPGPGDMEDYGYLLERAVLEATELGLGTCWLGGTFNKSSFARKIDVQKDEVMPAVVATGYPTEDSHKHWMRRRIGAERRLPPERLFFEDGPATPLDLGATAATDSADADALARLLEVVRWAPSASNKQPWRVVRDGKNWHFYLQRTPGYSGGLLKSFIKLADLQRVDIGIAMCHFELAAKEARTGGAWVVAKPDIDVSVAGWEYAASWMG
jgi:nitroreductase